VNPAAEELGWDDNDLLQALNAVRQEGGLWHPTLTGMLLFGSRKALRRELPAVRVDYIRVPGKEWIEDSEKRFSASQDLRKLRAWELLRQMGKGSATYYLAGQNFPKAMEEHKTLQPEHTTLGGKHTTLQGGHTTLRDQLPADLKDAVGGLSGRPGLKIRPVIQRLCKWRRLTASEISQILSRRDSEAIRRDHLKPMVEDGDLAYLYPDMERHPQQAYLATEKE